MKALPNGIVLLVLLVSLGIGQEQICPPDVATAFTGDQVAIRQLTVMAVSGKPGNAQAQACLGLVYSSAEGVTKDAGQAVFWFRKSAELGYAAGQMFLGESYFYGNGVPKDAAQAVFWYRKAAAQGYAAGQYSLGLMYDTGVGVPKDAAQAVFWYGKAAERGDTDAQSNLGASFAVGVGVPKDLVMAYMWRNLAAAKGNEIAKNARDALEKEMTPAQIAEAQKLSREWKPRNEAIANWRRIERTARDHCVIIR